MVEVFCDSFQQVPRRIVLDIDDTEDRVHGGQQLALFNAYYDSRCFQPIHIYEATTAKPVAIILRPGKTPDGAEVTLVLRHVIGHIRARWPSVDIIVRATAITRGPKPWRGASASASATSSASPATRCCCAGSAISPRMLHSVGSTARPTKCAATATSATPRQAGRSSVVSSPASRPPLKASTAALSSPTCAGLPKSLYEKIYCARGQAENLIKAHKLHLASDRTSCTKATANQFRLLIHTAAYWLMLNLRGLAPRTSFWRDAQFDTIRLCLIKVAGRVTEMVTRIKIALPSAFPYQAGFADLVGSIAKLPP